MKGKTNFVAQLLTAFGLAIFVALLYYPLLFTNRVLASGDILLYFYPYRDYAAAALREGRIPLWNPYIFNGVPFLANPQAAVLYPLHWGLSWLPVTKQIYWSGAIHTWILGYGGYLLTRRLRLGALAGVTTAVVLAGSGFYGGLLGHINQMNGAAWLPWALLIFCRAAQTAHGQEKWRQQLPGMAGQTAAFALLVALMVLAGHTQTAYINLFGVGLWLVAAGLSALPTWRLSRANFATLAGALCPPLLVFGAGAALGALLCAAQLLPTLELSALGLRGGGLRYGEVSSFSLRPLQLFWTLAPSYGLRDLSAIFGPGYTEYVGYVGLIGLGLATIGAWQGRGEARRMGLFFTLVGLFLALGRWNPFYYLLYLTIPGFDLFRVPARWLMLYTLGMALLAGGGLAWIAQKIRDRRHETRDTRYEMRDTTLVSRVSLSRVSLSRISCLLICLTLAGELLYAAQALPHTHPTAPQAVYDVRTAPAHLLTDPVRREVDPAAMGRFLGMSTITYDPGDMADWRRVLVEDAPQPLDEQSFSQFIIGLKIQELLVPNLPLFWRIPAVDGFDGGVLPLQRYNHLLGLFVPPTELVPDGRLREQVKTMPSADLLGLFNVQYIITDKVRDLWFDHVYYDRQLGARLSATQPTLTVTAPLAFEATHLDLIGYLAADHPSLHESNQPVVALTVTTQLGMTQALTISGGAQNGADLAEPTLDSPQAQATGAVVALRDVGAGRQAYHVRLPLGQPVAPTTITLQSLPGAPAVVIEAMTLYDERTKMFVPLLPSDRGDFQLVHSGDVKIYENRQVRPRAYLVHQVLPAADEPTALTLVQSDARVQRGEAAVIEGEITDNALRVALQPTAATTAGRQPTTDEATITHYQPEEVVVQTESSRAAFLVLSDTAFPGWQAAVDGQAAPLYITNYLFRGVAVPAGRHTVSFQYAPASWQAGLWLSSLGLLVLGTLLWYQLRCHQR